MDRLAGFAVIIFDANCIIYHCFRVDLKVDATVVSVTSRFTPHTRQITEKLIANNQKVTTTQAAFDEVRDCVFNAVEERMSDREVEAQLGYAQGEKVPDQIKLKVTQSVEKHVRKLQTSTSWFYVDTGFVPDGMALRALKRFFDSQSTATLGKSKPPSQVDMELINCGSQRQLPLVTNDRGISNFAEQLIAARLAFRLHNLMDIDPR